MRMRTSQMRAGTRRRRVPEGANWLNFSDLMSSLLLIFILIMFYIMYQYFDMYEINMAEIARQQYDLDQANASLDEERSKLSAAVSFSCWSASVRFAWSRSYCWRAISAMLISYISKY